jgi:hypothetical protein
VVLVEALAVEVVEALEVVAVQVEGRAVVLAEAWAVEVV